MLGPSPGAYANRRYLSLLLGVGGVLIFLIIAFNSGPDYSQPAVPRPQSPVAYSKTPIHHVDVEVDTLKGDAIMPKLGNETLKAELGRAAWKLFHTTMARFPDKPNEDEQTALFSYIHLFARLYPCGECAGHFRQILQQYPPQVTSRSKAAVWACFVHNEVNKSLKKEEFDCSKIGDFYDCGCADDETEASKKLTSGVKDASSESTGKIVGSGGGVRVKETEKGQELMLEREGRTLGG